MHQSASTRIRGATDNRYKERGRRFKWFVRRAESPIHGTMKFILKEHHEATAALS